MTNTINTTFDCQVRRLGVMPYAEAWAMQEQLAKLRGADEIPDTLLLVEHPHTYTLGTSAHDENLLFTLEQLETYGIEVHWVNRGGDITYHGPGQLVGYPIIKLPAGADGLHADVIDYVRRLERTLIALLATYDIRAYAYPSYTGVWLDSNGVPAKIAAIGVKVNTRRVTLHGFALNVNTDLDYFKGIIPCGIADKPVTSMQVVLDCPLDIAEVAARTANAFGAVFGKTMIPE
ncbi:MAG: lipoyl(octanoyl) transferase LipB [Chloroflexota bacterium]